jgi:hypothetical protein
MTRQASIDLLARAKGGLKNAQVDASKVTLEGGPVWHERAISETQHGRAPGVSAVEDCILVK